MFSKYLSALPRPATLFSAVAAAFIGMSAPAAYAQNTFYSSSTTFAQHSQNVTVNASTANLTTAGTGNPGAFRPQDYLGYNVSGMGTRASGGTFVPSAGGAYPAGWEFSDAMVETGTGTVYGVSTTANVTFTGATTNYSTSGGALNTNTWLKGATESGGLWTVKAGDTCMLGGFTSAANNQTGSVTLNLGGDFSSWGTLIGTQTGATLGVTIAGYAAVGNTLGSAIFSYEVDNIGQNTTNSTFTGWTNNKQKVNTIVITGLQNKSSAPAMPAAYSAYPAGSYIALDQVRVGNAEVPEPASLLLALAGTSLLGRARRRKQAQ